MIRTETLVYIALGSNLDDPTSQIQRALHALRQLPETELVKCAPWYRSSAIGPGVQDDYINTVAALNTKLSPTTLLHALQTIETVQGRTREQRWAARTLDLDILLYGDLNMDTPELKLPHPRLLDRDFVLAPLSDLAPDLHLGHGNGAQLPIKEWLANCPSTGIFRL